MKGRLFSMLNLQWMLLWGSYSENGQRGCHPQHGVFTGAGFELSTNRITSISNGGVTVLKVFITIKNDFCVSPLRYSGFKRFACPSCDYCSILLSKYISGPSSCPCRNINLMQSFLKDSKVYQSCIDIDCNRRFRILLVIPPSKKNIRYDSREW